MRTAAESTLLQDIQRDRAFRQSLREGEEKKEYKLADENERQRIKIENGILSICVLRKNNLPIPEKIPRENIRTRRCR